MTSENVDSLLRQAQAHFEVGDQRKALLNLMEARNALDMCDTAGELQILLLLARIYQRQEDLATARLYTEEIAELLMRTLEISNDDRADAYLGLARLAPDIGQLATGLQYAQQALRLYQQSKSLRGQFDAHILCKLIRQQRGHHQAALAHLEAATQLAQILDLDQANQAILLNTRAHTYWYQGQLAPALSMAQEAVTLADIAGPLKFRVYNRLLCANIQRARQNFASAEAMYSEAARTVEVTGFSLFHIWIEANWSWLNLLQGQFEQARRRLYIALETADKGQAASFNVFLSAVYSLTGRYAEAEELLRNSLHFYLTSGDDLSVFALRIHLAYVYLKTNRVPTGEEYLALALTWANEWNVDYFPHWWHPRIVTEVCVHALAGEIHPAYAERILVKRVGKESVPLLRQLLYSASAESRRRAADALSLLGNMPLAEVTETHDEQVQNVLMQLLAKGVLQEAHLGNLAQRLQANREAGKTNAVLLATFGLYMQGISRKEIARRLDRSDKTIRNYITLIYECFGIEPGGSRSARRQRLLALARAEEIISGKVPSNQMSQ